MKKIFGTDGIRCNANEWPLTPQPIVQFCMAVAVFFRNGNRQRVVIGKDPRLSSYTLEYLITGALLAMGVDVILLGPIPTPAVPVLARSYRTDFGVMITASHNLFFDNGVKLFGPTGHKLSEADERQIEALFSTDLTEHLALPQDRGRVWDGEGAVARYIEAAKGTLSKKINLNGIRIVIDAGNGAGYKAVQQAFWELGADVVSIGDRPNGLNINESGATNPKYAVNMVKERRADFGITIDGDADRLIVVDEKGEIVDGDQLIALAARVWRDENPGTAGVVVGTVMSNLGLEHYVQSLGLTFIRTPVGDRFVSEAIREHDAILGGEQSGHIIFPKLSTTGDALVAALQVAGTIVCKGKPASEVCHLFTRAPQFLRNVTLRDRDVLGKETVQRAIHQAKETLGDDYVVVRLSGTEPLVRIMVQGDNEQLVKEMLALILTAIEQAS